MERLTIKQAVRIVRRLDLENTFKGTRARQAYEVVCRAALKLEETERQRDEYRATAKAINDEFVQYLPIINLAKGCEEKWAKMNDAEKVPI